ncbi:hypothetical protein GCM10023213_22900 [Prosthecobacter algae]|uniref:Uncharacterized protein n=1 Tax=Prosthecobacter algae TaxID=1144682 RepID=A0ABP9P454_9BACT
MKVAGMTMATCIMKAVGTITHMTRLIMKAAAMTTHTPMAVIMITVMRPNPAAAMIIATTMYTRRTTITATASWKKAGGLAGWWPS